MTRLLPYAAALALVVAFDKITRVCSYDRAGDEWSDAGPEWDTIKQVSTILMHGSKMVVNARPTF
ncbi:MAG: hypothetical protein DMG53_23220 [Acidobacteria bacterium]|nr:MAG: hypothetical protein DMG53_23220 [Acidobacteriota bacterium]